MRKVFFSNLILLILLNVLIKPFYILGIDAAVQNTVGAETYGAYFALLNFSFIFNILLDLGINNYNTRNIAQSPQVLKNYLGAMIGLRFSLFILYFIVAIIFGVLLGYNKQELSILWILLLNQFFVGIVQYFRSNFSGLHFFKIDALLSVVDRILLITVCSFLLWSKCFQGLFKIEWFIWAQTISYGSTAVLAFVLTLFYTGKPKIRLKYHFSLALLKKSFPYAVLITLMMLYNRLDSVMLERILPNGKLQAGIYAQGFRLLDAVSMFALLFAGLLLPMFSRMLKQNENFSSLLCSATSSLLVFATLIAINCAVFSVNLIQWRYSEHISEAAQTFVFLIISFVPIATSYIYGTLLTANGSLKQLNWMALAGLISNVALNLYLIPLYGAVGAAIATFLTQFSTASAQMFIAYRILHLKVNLRLILKFMLLSLCSLSVALILHSYFNELFGFFIATITGFVMALFLGLFPLKEAFRVLLNKI
jgi:O-antigen/teichoic acid export membrane protein